MGVVCVCCAGSVGMAAWSTASQSLGIRHGCQAGCEYGNNDTDNLLGTVMSLQSIILPRWVSYSPVRPPNLLSYFYTRLPKQWQTLAIHVPTFPSSIVTPSTNCFFCRTARGATPSVYTSAAPPQPGYVTASPDHPTAPAISRTSATYGGPSAS